MTDYTPANPDVYTKEELQQAVGFMLLLLEECNRGNIDQHASPAILIALDCINGQVRKGQKIRVVHCDVYHHGKPYKMAKSGLLLAQKRGTGGKGRVCKPPLILTVLEGQTEGEK